MRQGRHDLLPATDLEFPAGEVVIALGPPGPTLTALAMTVAGRMTLSQGQVRYDGTADAEALRRAVALVDIPEITEPERGVPVRTLVSEELALAGRPSGRAAAEAWLREHDRADWAGLRAEEVPPLERVNGLADLAALRPGVTHLVIGFPERHGGPPADWLAVAQRHADAGLGVLLTVSYATATEHDASYVIGAAVGASTATADTTTEIEEDA